MTQPAKPEYQRFYLKVFKQGRKHPFVVKDHESRKEVGWFFTREEAQAAIKRWSELNRTASGHRPHSIRTVQGGLPTLGKRR